MTVFLPPDALRAARALVGLNQRQVADRLHMSRKAITSCEWGNGATLEANQKLRQLYESEGIEFLGTADLSTGKVSGAGARWCAPVEETEQAADQQRYHVEPTMLAFLAARNLIGLDQSDVARMVGASPRRVGSIETGRGSTREMIRTLRRYYESRGIQFLGWPSRIPGHYLGVGVRWLDRPRDDAPGS